MTKDGPEDTRRKYVALHIINLIRTDQGDGKLLMGSLDCLQIDIGTDYGHSIIVQMPGQVGTHLTKTLNGHGSTVEGIGAEDLLSAGFHALINTEAGHQRGVADDHGFPPAEVKPGRRGFIGHGTGQTENVRDSLLLRNIGTACGHHPTPAPGWCRGWQ